MKTIFLLGAAFACIAFASFAGNLAQKPNILSDKAEQISLLQINAETQQAVSRRAIKPAHNRLNNEMQPK